MTSFCMQLMLTCGLGVPFRKHRGSEANGIMLYCGQRGCFGRATRPRQDSVCVRWGFLLCKRCTKAVGLDMLWVGAQATDFFSRNPQYYFPHVMSYTDFLD